jgi:hypothetical protein
MNKLLRTTKKPTSAACFSGMTLAIFVFSFSAKKSREMMLPDILPLLLLYFDLSPSGYFINQTKLPPSNCLRRKSSFQYIGIPDSLDCLSMSPPSSQEGNNNVNVDVPSNRDASTLENCLTMPFDISHMRLICEAIDTRWDLCLARILSTLKS